MNPLYTPTPTGLLLIDKPAQRGVTSMTAVRAVRRSLKHLGCSKRAKVGHAGTLDPLASGLLILLLGNATTRCESLMGKPKRYTTTIDCARTNDCFDFERPPVHTALADVPASRAPSRSDIESLLAEKFTGVVMQSPPIHSAIVIDGERSYKRARAGDRPELKPRPITISRISLTEYDWPYLSLDITCSKGTYIRSLARDIPRAIATDLLDLADPDLITTGVLTRLRRTHIAEYDVADALPLDDLKQGFDTVWLLPTP